MNVFFTADTHFQHERIIRFCSRPFTSGKEMDVALFRNWNSVVRPDDVVYHLGDVVFGDVERALPLLRGLMGKKYLIPGNHDTPKTLALLDGIFEILPPLTEIPTPPRSRTAHETARSVTMCHYAMEVWNHSHRGAIMLHGHTHGRLPENSQRLDVGVDSWGFFPVRLQDVLARLRTLPEYSSPGKGKEVWNEDQ